MNDNNSPSLPLSLFPSFPLSLSLFALTLFSAPSHTSYARALGAPAVASALTAPVARYARYTYFKSQGSFLYTLQAGELSKLQTFTTVADSRQSSQANCASMKCDENEQPTRVGAGTSKGVYTHTHTRRCFF